MSDKTDDTAPKKKKGGILKWLMILVGVIVLAGGGAVGTLYAMGMPPFAAGGGGGHSGPRLVPRAEQRQAEAKGGEGHGGEGGGGGHGGAAPPAPEGGDPHASNYYTMEREFTSNLQNSVHYVQIGIAVSKPYDDTVITNLRTHEIAVRSAILMALGETTEEQVFTAEGKRQLQRRVAQAINATLQQKSGFGGIGNVYFTSFVVQ